MSIKTPSDDDRTDLTNSQKRQYHLQKACGILADARIEVDHRTEKRGEADFLARTIRTGEERRVVVRSQLTFDERYQDGEVYIMFPDEGTWYLYPHDEMLDLLANEGLVTETNAWKEDEVYTSTSLSGAMIERLGSAPNVVRIATT